MKASLIKERNLCNNCLCPITKRPVIIFRGKHKFVKGNCVVNASLRANSENASVIKEINHELISFFVQIFILVIKAN